MSYARWGEGCHWYAFGTSDDLLTLWYTHGCLWDKDKQGGEFHKTVFLDLIRTGDLEDWIYSRWPIQDRADYDKVISIIHQFLSDEP
jgi:hypothetical protein